MGRNAKLERVPEGMRRQWAADLARWNTGELEAVAATLTSRPRKALGWKTPGEAINDLLSSTQESNVATIG